ncbi:MAG: RIP metalloprotease RseP [Dethiobacteria bacterium]|nr:RIP metalloprotease RseP [Bacillota bacterium]
MQTLLASVFVFGLLIFAHESGHYLAAKASGIEVIEFAIGLGPRLFGWEKNKTKYSLRVFPLGGFCRMLGEDPDEIGLKGSFQEQPLIKRFFVIAAGPLMNFLLAVLLFSLIYFLFLGVPLTKVPVVGAVEPGGQAEAAGIQEGDHILSVNETAVNNWSEVVALINAHPEEQIEITLRREEETKVIRVIPALDTKTGKGFIGIAPVMKKYDPLGSLTIGIEYSWWLIKFIFVSIYRMITGQIPPDVSGPVAIIQTVGEVAETGFSNLLSLAAVISINLGIINLLPIPALDGSRLFFILVEGIRGKPFDPQKEGFIHFIGFTILILLMLFIAFNDLLKLGIF